MAGLAGEPYPTVPIQVEQMEYPREVVPRPELVATVSSGEGTELPHWADPPTGEVPRALADQHGEDDEMQAWRLLGSRGLHWRDDVNDWSNGPGVEDLVDDHDDPVTPPPPSRGGPYSFDEEFERLERERTGRASGLSDTTSPGGPGVSESTDATTNLFDGAPEGASGPAPAGAGADFGAPPEATNWGDGGQAAEPGAAAMVSAEPAPASPAASKWKLISKA